VWGVSIVSERLRGRAASRRQECGWLAHLREPPQLSRARSTSTSHASSGLYITQKRVARGPPLTAQRAHRDEDSGVVLCPEKDIPAVGELLDEEGVVRRLDWRAARYRQQQNSSLRQAAPCAQERPRARAVLRLAPRARRVPGPCVPEGPRTARVWPESGSIDGKRAM